LGGKEGISMKSGSTIAYVVAVAVFALLPFFSGCGGAGAGSSGISGGGGAVAPPAA